jgi:hypothetical protein
VGERIRIESDCPYAEGELYRAPRRGTVSTAYICHHPEREGCWCLYMPFAMGRCRIRIQAEERMDSQLERS